MLTGFAGTDRRGATTGSPARRRIRNSAAAAAGLSCGGCSGTTTRTGSGAPACPSPGPAARRRAPRRAADGPPAGGLRRSASVVGLGRTAPRAPCCAADAGPRAGVCCIDSGTAPSPRLFSCRRGRFCSGSV